MAIRLAVIPFITFINPDSAIFLRYDFLILSQRLPLYPILVHTLSLIGLDPFFTGKAINAIFGSLAILPIARIMSRLKFGETPIFWACFFYLFSPLPFCNQVQAMSEGVFLFFFLFTVDFFFGLMEHLKWTDLFGILFCAGMASLTRAEGYILVPLILFGLFVYIKRQGFTADLPPAFIGLFPFFLLLIWYFYVRGDVGYLKEYSMNLSDFSIRNALERLFTNAVIVFAGNSPIIGGVGLFGLINLKKFGKSQTALVLAYLLCGLLLGISLHWKVDFRFCIAPAVLLILPAAFSTAISRRRLIAFALGIQIIWAIAIGGALTKGAGTAGQNITQVSEYLPNMEKKATIFSNEQATTGYYLQSLIWPFGENIHGRKGVVVLHSQFSLDMIEQQKWLRKEYDCEILFAASGQCGGIRYGESGVVVQSDENCPYSVVYFVRKKAE